MTNFQLTQPVTWHERVGFTNKDGERFGHIIHLTEWSALVEYVAEWTDDFGHRTIGYKAQYIAKHNLEAAS